LSRIWEISNLRPVFYLKEQVLFGVCISFMALSGICTFGRVLCSQFDQLKATSRFQIVHREVFMYHHSNSLEAIKQSSKAASYTLDRLRLPRKESAGPDDSRWSRTNHYRNKCCDPRRRRNPHAHYTLSGLTSFVPCCLYSPPISR
jgi:hypothetical protein